VENQEYMSQAQPTRSTRSPADVLGLPFVIARAGLYPHDSKIVELIEVGRTRVRATAAEAGHDGIKEIFDARSLRIQIHAAGRDALLEEPGTRSIKA